MRVWNMGKVAAAAAVLAVSLSACVVGQQSSAPVGAMEPAPGGTVPTTNSARTPSSQERQTPTSKSPASTRTSTPMDDNTCQRALLKGSFGVNNNEKTNYVNGFLNVTNTQAYSGASQ
jgi:hypothetical protein